MIMAPTSKLMVGKMQAYVETNSQRLCSYPR